MLQRQISNFFHIKVTFTVSSIVMGVFDRRLMIRCGIYKYDHPLPHPSRRLMDQLTI